MERQQPNESGVYLPDVCEHISIPIPKGIKAQLDIYLVVAADGLWRESTSYRFGGSNVGDFGGGSLPSDRGTSYPTRAAALRNAVNSLIAEQTRCTLTEPKRRALLYAIESFNPGDDETPDPTSRHFCFGSEWTKYPLPEPNPLILASDMPPALCRICPLATRAHILVPIEGKEHSYAKYCTVTAIAAGLLESSAALDASQGDATTEEMVLLDALVERFSGQCTACTRKVECAQQSPGPDAECLARRDHAATWVDAVALEPAPTASSPKPVPQLPAPPEKDVFIFGWMSEETEIQWPMMLYVVRERGDWGVTYAPEEATRFKNVDAVLSYYRKIGHVHGDPEANIYSGFLRIFQYGPAGLRLVPRLTRQVSLFDAPLQSLSDSAPVLEIAEQQPDLFSGADTADLFSHDEHKLLRAGFVLVRYDREAKTVQRTWDDPAQGWAPAVQFNTYAAAERTLKEVLQQEQVVEVTLEGRVNMHSSSLKKVYAAGFEMYRAEGIIPGHGYPRIKQGSKGWGTWQKFESAEKCQAAWDDLMKDEKALRG